MASRSTPYRGRFAPSPTGPLHQGSLVAAVASFLDARHHGGTWLVRMENIDPPREPEGAAEAILHSLRMHGLDWDEDILWQGDRASAYDEALTTLQAHGHLFLCGCTRRAMGPSGSCAGNCREQQACLEPPLARRVDVASTTDIRFEDLWQGTQHWPLGQSIRDFPVLRKDGLYAYQLAVVVDDAAQGINHVVRGSDLLDSTPRQIYLQTLLGLPTPVYGHFPVMLNRDGYKLSKQTKAAPINDNHPLENLRLALAFLRQQAPPSDLGTPAELLAFAAANWSRARLPDGMAFVAN